MHRFRDPQNNANSAPALSGSGTGGAALGRLLPGSSASATKFWKAAAEGVFAHQLTWDRWEFALEAGSVKNCSLASCDPEFSVLLSCHSQPTSMEKGEDLLLFSRYPTEQNAPECLCAVVGPFARLFEAGLIETDAEKIDWKTHFRLTEKGRGALFEAAVLRLPEKLRNELVSTRTITQESIAAWARKDAGGMRGFTRACSALELLGVAVVSYNTRKREVTRLPMGEDGVLRVFRSVEGNAVLVSGPENSMKAWASDSFADRSARIMVCTPRTPALQASSARAHVIAAAPLSQALDLLAGDLEKGFFMLKEGGSRRLAGEGNKLLLLKKENVERARLQHSIVCPEELATVSLRQNSEVTIPQLGGGFLLVVPREKMAAVFEAVREAARVELAPDADPFAGSQSP